jgi:hypothetical protein
MPSEPEGEMQSALLLAFQDFVDVPSNLMKEKLIKEIDLYQKSVFKMGPKENPGPPDSHKGT